VGNYRGGNGGGGENFKVVAVVVEDITEAVAVVV
jgi:hypothetical protein